MIRPSPMPSTLLGRALRSSSTGMGSRPAHRGMVEEFEREFATFCAVRNCVGGKQRTDALRFILLASGIGPVKSS